MPIIHVNRAPSAYADGADLTLDGRVANPEIATETVDVTTLNDAARRNDVALQSVTMSYTGLYTSTAARSYQTIRDMMGTFKPVSVYLEGDSSGSRGIGLSSARAENLAPSGGPGEALEIAANILQDGTWDDIVALTDKRTATVTYTGGTYNRGASSTNGGAFYVHVMNNVATGGNAQWNVALEHASAGGTFDVAASANIGSGTTTGTVLTFSGTFRATARAVFTRDATGGTLVAKAAFAAR